MKNQLKTIFLLGILSALLIAFGSTLGPSFFYGFILLAILLNFGAYFFSDRLVLKMSGAQEVTREEAPELHARVEELARQTISVLNVRSVPKEVFDRQLAFNLYPALEHNEEFIIGQVRDLTDQEIARLSSARIASPPAGSTSSPAAWSSRKTARSSAPAPAPPRSALPSPASRGSPTRSGDSASPSAPAR